jgi:hypothetical protein
MILTNEQLASQYGQMQENALVDVTKRWPQNTVKYDLRYGLSANEKYLVRKALYELQKKLDFCLRFEEASSGNRILVNNDADECSSRVGYLNRPQRLTLASGCMDKGTIQHEFLHAIGIFHTQSRYDRKGHIKILWKNIKEKYKYNFNFEHGTDPYGLPYDYDSVMHYGARYFSKNGEITIKTMDPSKQNVIGTRDGVSDGDVKLIKKMYCLH